MPKKHLALTAILITILMTIFSNTTPGLAMGGPAPKGHELAIIYRSVTEHKIINITGRPCPRTSHSTNIYSTSAWDWALRDVVVTTHVVITTTNVRCEVSAPTAMPPRPTTLPPAATPRPTARPCTPQYAEPTLTLTSVDPPYPIPLGQDPEDEGFDVTITARGGAKTNGCNRGPDRASLESLSVESVNLSAATISWIENALSRYYPGARVLGTYPLTPNGDVSINGTTGTISFHVDSHDPGTYVIEVEARQDRGNDRTNTETFTVRVWLMEGTIWGGGGN